MPCNASIFIQCRQWTFKNVYTSLSSHAFYAYGPCRQSGYLGCPAGHRSPVRTIGRSRRGRGRYCITVKTLSRVRGQTHVGLLHCFMSRCFGAPITERFWHLPEDIGCSAWLECSAGQSTLPVSQRNRPGYPPTQEYSLHPPASRVGPTFWKELYSSDTLFKRPQSRPKWTRSSDTGEQSSKVGQS